MSNKRIYKLDLKIASSRDLLVRGVVELNDLIAVLVVVNSVRERNVESGMLDGDVVVDAPDCVVVDPRLE